MKVLLLESGGKKVVGGLGGSLSAGGSDLALRPWKPSDTNPFRLNSDPKLLPQNVTYGGALYFSSAILIMLGVTEAL